MSRKKRKVFVLYDKMCHIDNLRKARKPLPLPGDLQLLWSDINKIIDSLHLQNLERPKVPLNYQPTADEGNKPTYNTMYCEQTFAWLRRYKTFWQQCKKIHHHFYLHCMVKRQTSIFPTVMQMDIDQFNLKYIK